MAASAFPRVRRDVASEEAQHGDQITSGLCARSIYMVTLKPIITPQTINLSRLSSTHVVGAAPRYTPR